MEEPTAGGKPRRRGRARNAVGLTFAYAELVRLLVKRGALKSEDVDHILRRLTDLSGAYEMKPEPRASIEELSKTLMTMSRRMKGLRSTNR